MRNNNTEMVTQEIIPTSGVPQGSILGPLFFKIFINDIVNGLLSLKLLFADDFKLYREISTISDCVHLQDDLLKLNRWCHENKLDLNLNKCTVMSITI
jgi:ribonuclease P/MRP protein subunit RPP40